MEDRSDGVSEWAARVRPFEGEGARPRAPRTGLHRRASPTLDNAGEFVICHLLFVIWTSLRRVPGRSLKMFLHTHLVGFA